MLLEERLFLNTNLVETKMEALGSEGRKSI
jgi:hypothetical protein